MKLFTIPIPIVLAVVCATLCGVLIVGFVVHSTSPTPTFAKAQTPFPHPFLVPEDSLVAHAAVVYDPTDDKILYSKNADEPRPLASLTKLMAAEIVLSTSKKPLKTPIVLTKNDLTAVGDAGDWGFHAGDTVTLGDLIKFGLVASSNDAMAAAAASLEGDSIADMNRAAGALHLSHTYFLNPTGLDVSTSTAGAYGSAMDVARLAGVFLKSYPQFFELTSRPLVSIPLSHGTLVANATTQPLLDIPGLLAAKTGYTDLAGGNLVAAYDVDINHPLIAVVLGSSELGRFTDIRTLINASRL